MEIPDNTLPGYKTPPEFSLAWTRMGTSKIIRDYVKLWPDKLPLPVGIRHGYYYRADQVVHDFFRSPLKVFWTYGDREFHFLVSNGHALPKDVPQCGHPLLYLPVPEQKERNGTIAMPSTIMEGHEHNFDEFCKELAGLEKQFHPVAVCLRWYMVHLVDTCKKYGLTPVCSGKSEVNFYPNIVKLVSRYKYLVSSYMGTPIFLGMHCGCESFMSYTVLRSIGDDSKVEPRGLEQYFYKHSLLDSRDADLRKDFFKLHMGTRHKKTPQRLMELFNWAKHDFTYRYLMSIFATGSQEYKFWKDVHYLACEGLHKYNY